MRNSTICQTPSGRRFSLAAPLLAALLLAAVSTARADTITYNITSLANLGSVVFQDSLHPPILLDTFTGTITASSTGAIEGTWNVGNVPVPTITLTYDLTMSNSTVGQIHVAGGTDDVANMINVEHTIQGGGLTITPTDISILNPNLSSSFLRIDDGPFFVGGPVIESTWNGNLIAQANFNSQTAADIEILTNGNNIYGAGATWEIATAAAPIPEPSTLALATLGLGLVVLRRRRRTIETNGT
jgi:PEP-CTERM motif